MKGYGKQVEEERPAKRGWALSRSGILSYGLISAEEVELTDDEVTAFKAVKGYKS